jgi:Cd2+/Zn2+-exporting ATPase
MRDGAYIETRSLSAVDEGTDMNKTYRIGGMDCTHCAETIEKGVSRLPGVVQASVDLASATMTFEGTAAENVLRQRVEALGYRLEDEISPGATKHAAQEKQQTGGIIGFFRYLLTQTDTRLAVAGGAIILIGMVASLLGASELLVNVVYAIATLVALYPVAVSGVRALWINRDFNINLLMSIAAIGAILINETLEAATVVFLFAVGEALEGYTTDRARQSIRSLMTLAPARAIRLENGQESDVPVEALAIGDVILVKPGERIPMDGKVLRGESGVDQSPVTGESVPVLKTHDDEVFAGTINGSGALEISVTRLAVDNTIQRIIRLVEEAQSVRAPSQRLIDQFARVYTPAVVLIAVVVAIVPPLLFNAPFYDLADGTHGWLYRALSVLVIACPCALVISTPVTVISAITAAARRGVLIKGGAHLEVLGRVHAFAFDKTGTLTRGKPAVTAVRSIDCETGKNCELCDDVLALASAVERRSAHPLAQAVVDAAQTRGLSDVYAPAEAVESLAGRGVQGQMRDKRVTIGSHSLFDAEHPHSPQFCQLVQDVEANGQTAMLLCDGDRVRGFIAVSDAVRPESAEVVASLRNLGQHTVMLTGDNATVAAAVGQQLNIDEVRAGLLPADKLTALHEVQTTHGNVAMVGDGINDTPALAAANVGIAMGGAGSAQALETADVALMADDLRQLPFAVRLSRFARHLIKQNVIISFGVKALFVVLALNGATALWAAILADVGTSLVVTLNGMRPLRFEQQG